MSYGYPSRYEVKMLRLELQSSQVHTLKSKKITVLKPFKLYLKLPFNFFLFTNKMKCNVIVTVKHCFGWSIFAAVHYLTNLASY